MLSVHSVHKIRVLALTVPVMVVPYHVRLVKIHQEQEVILVDAVNVPLRVLSQHVQVTVLFMVAVVMSYVQIVNRIVRLIVV